MDNEPKWPLGFELGELAAIAGGVVERGDPSQIVSGLFHDTRQPVRGAMFLALRGENFDGHAYIREAVAAGAAGALVSEEIPHESIPNGFFVARAPDTLEALGRLACARRMRYAIPVIAVAGSSGKTTTKDMIAHVLSAELKVHKTSGTRNNRVGLPLTLLELTDEHQAAVVEVGMNQRGELEALTRIAAPSLGALTNVGLAHVGMFGNEQELMSAKGEFVANLPGAAILCYNYDCERSRLLVKNLARGRRRSVGEDRDADNRITEVALEGIGYRFRLLSEGRPIKIAVPCFGRYNVANAAMAASVALELGMDSEAIARRLGTFGPGELRGQRIEVGGVTIIADCYNANPDSTFAALESLSDTPTSGWRFVVLGDMLELGEASENLHTRIGRGFGARRVEHLVTVGELSRAVSASACEVGQEATHVSEAAEAVDVLAEMLAPGDLVLVKGSRAMRLERVVEALKERLGEGDG